MFFLSSPAQKVTGANKKKRQLFLPLFHLTTFE
ncbi:hypothetical protein SGRA_1808 [Saprospira grandis str. Lewin]|uniref:Uncharacterized protein n=1 Tax=Saprospira grandis (strain Lewin) TaxID=984262 RepID=H6L0K7_SAPGL|nr:hypothetical protein SGRA_1808 [Saprospira grandis str. Lewin]